jgi:hypothetical protein
VILDLASGNNSSFSLLTLLQQTIFLHVKVSKSISFVVIHTEVVPPS